MEENPIIQPAQLPNPSVQKLANSNSDPEVQNYYLPPTKKIITKKRIIIALTIISFFILVLIIALIKFNGYMNSYVEKTVPIPTLIPTKAIAKPDNSKNPYLDWHTIDNQKYHFQFKCPPDWTTTESCDLPFSFVSIDFATLASETVRGSAPQTLTALDKKEFTQYKTNTDNNILPTIAGVWKFVYVGGIKSVQGIYFDYYKKHFVIETHLFTNSTQMIFSAILPVKTFYDDPKDTSSIAPDKLPEKAIELGNGNMDRKTKEIVSKYNMILASFTFTELVGDYPSSPEELLRKMYGIQLDCLNNFYDPTNVNAVFLTDQYCYDKTKPYTTANREIHVACGNRLPVKEEIQIDTASISGQIAKINTHVVWKNGGKDTPAMVQLVYTNSQWKVESIICK